MNIYTTYDEGGSISGHYTGEASLEANGISIQRYESNRHGLGKSIVQATEWVLTSDDRFAKGFRSNMKNTIAGIGLTISTPLIVAGSIDAFVYLSVASDLDILLGCEGSLSDNIENKYVKDLINVTNLLSAAGGGIKAWEKGEKLSDIILFLKSNYDGLYSSQQIHDRIYQYVLEREARKALAKEKEENPNR